MRHSFPATVLAATALFLSAGAAAAQSCLGLPLRDGQIAIGATAALGDVDHFGGQFTGDVTGPVSLRFGYGGLGSNDDRQTFSALVAYDFYLLDPAVCAVGGLLFEDRGEGVVEERFGVPLGIGIGKTIRGPAFDATLYAVPQYVWVRDRLRTADADEETSHAVMAEAGATLGFGPVYGSGSVVVGTLSGQDPAVRIGVGLIF